MLRALDFLIKLEGPFSTVKSIIQAAGLSLNAWTHVIPATDFLGEPCSFYRINMMDKLAIEEWPTARSRWAQINSSTVSRSGLLQTSWTRNPIDACGRT